MPFVRYARDRRGYETLYVMHAFDGPERSPRPRVLYACRTVPYAKVGRSTIDESVQRRLEEAYPTLTFDWPRLLKEAAQSAPRPERQDARTQEPRRGKGRTKQVRQVREVRQVRLVRDQVQPVREVQEVQVPEVPEVPEVPQSETPIPVSESPEAFEVPEPLEPITELIEWGTEPTEPIEPTEPREFAESPDSPLPPLTVSPSWPSVNLIGTTATLVLRGRFIELASKIQSRVSDPTLRQRLFQEAARLNPEGWTTAEQAQAGIDSFETRYARLAEQLRQ